jgi:hypothetical protein
MSRQAAEEVVRIRMQSNAGSKLSPKELSSAQIAKQVKAFLKRGGKIKKIPRGASAIGPFQYVDTNTHKIADMKSLTERNKRGL